MKKRQWDSATKAKIVMGSVMSIKSANHSITAGGISSWPTHAAAFETDKLSKAEERLKKENQRLKGIIGELHVELKKTTGKKTGPGERAVDIAVNTQFPEGVRGKSLSLMSDNGCQPTANSFKRQCSDMGIKQAFTSYNNPKGNADTERMFRTLKEELLWINQ